jgi:NADPH-dependent glutamate synthase beta subunit-like oxidoreductase
MVITAIGQAARDEFLLPAHPKVFVGGDYSNGGAEIVNAAAEGVRAAAKIDEMLATDKGGKGRRKKAEEGGQRRTKAD